jgi:hypothetical protein
VCNDNWSHIVASHRQEGDGDRQTSRQQVPVHVTWKLGWNVAEYPCSAA